MKKSWAKSSGRSQCVPGSPTLRRFPRRRREGWSVPAPGRVPLGDPCAGEGRALPAARPELSSAGWRGRGRLRAGGRAGRALPSAVVSLARGSLSEGRFAARCRRQLSGRPGALLLHPAGTGPALGSAVVSAPRLGRAPRVSRALLCVSAPVPWLGWGLAARAGRAGLDYAGPRCREGRWRARQLARGPRHDCLPSPREANGSCQSRSCRLTPDRVRCPKMKRSAAFASAACSHRFVYPPAPALGSSWRGTGRGRVAPRPAAQLPPAAANQLSRFPRGLLAGRLQLGPCRGAAAGLLPLAAPAGEASVPAELPDGAGEPGRCLGPVWAGKFLAAVPGHGSFCCVRRNLLGEITGTPALPRLVKRCPLLPRPGRLRCSRELGGASQGRGAARCPVLLPLPREPAPLAGVRLGPRRVPEPGCAQRPPVGAGFRWALGLKSPSHRGIWRPRIRISSRNLFPESCLPRPCFVPWDARERRGCARIELFGGFHPILDKQ